MPSWAARAVPEAGRKRLTRSSCPGRSLALPEAGWVPSPCHLLGRSQRCFAGSADDSGAAAARTEPGCPVKQDSQQEQHLLLSSGRWPWLWGWGHSAAGALQMVMRGGVRAVREAPRGWTLSPSERAAALSRPPRRAAAGHASEGAPCQGLPWHRRVLIS